MGKFKGYKRKKKAPKSREDSERDGYDLRPQKKSKTEHQSDSSILGSQEPKNTQSSGEVFQPKVRQPKDESDEEIADHYHIFGLNQIMNLLAGLLVCKECDSTLKIMEKKNARNGLCSTYYLKCDNCKITKNYTTNCPVNGELEDLNFRLYWASRNAGIGDEGSKSFCVTMNFNSPKSKIQKYQDKLASALEIVAIDSMKKAGRELKEKTKSKDVIGGFDCSWPKRGFSSLLGVMTCCSPVIKKIIDTYIMCGWCFICKGNKDFKNLKDDESSRNEKNRTRESSRSSRESSRSSGESSRSSRESSSSSRASTEPTDSKNRRCQCNFHGIYPFSSYSSEY